MSENEINFDYVYEGNEEYIRKICLKLCQIFLSKEWINIEEKDFVFRRLSGGFVNQTYYCSLPKYLDTKCDKVREVVIRFFGKFNTKSDQQKSELRINDTINSLVLSLNGLSPKVHGIFSCGQIQEYFKSRWFDIEEQKDLQIVTNVAKILAKIHSIKAPKSKFSKPIYIRLEEIYKNRCEKFPFNDLIAKTECKELLDIDFREEIIWIKSIALMADSPIVFSHKDFWGPNILVGECDAIRVCDLEFCSYGPRARDFASLFTLWGRKLIDFSNPLSHKLVENSVMEFFFEKYREEMIEVNGQSYENDEKNSIYKMVFETKLYVLIMRLFYALASIHLVENKIQFGNINFNSINYFQLKRQLIAEKLIASH